MMNDWLAELIARHSRQGVLVDANMMLLWFVGAFDRALIAKFKRTDTYTGEDFDLLVAFLSRFSRILTTPNILTEVSNLSSQLTGRMKLDYFGQFRERLELVEERYLPSSSIADRNEFARFGLTDSGIVELAETGVLVATDDFSLASLLESRGFDVLNFNHIRPYNWT